MTTRVCIPYEPELIGGLPEGLSASVYDGAGAPPGTASEVEFYVTPYSFDTYPLELIRTMPRLRVVQTLTAGVEHARPYVPDGVSLCNARGVHDASTAELAALLVLAGINDLPGFLRSQHERIWNFHRRDALADRTVVIVGHGSIGQAIERRLEPFECDIVPVASRSRGGVAGPEKLPELLPRASAVVLTVPATAQTRALVDADFLARMPDGALLVNVARGSVVDTGALLAELQSGRLRGALDVTDPEPLPPDHPLWSAPGLIMTPHVGGNSTAFLPRALRLIGEQLQRFAGGAPLANVVSR